MCSSDLFLYRTRKKALGPFKRQLWELPRRAEILDTQRERLKSLFTQLGVTGSRDLVERWVPAANEQLPPAPDELILVR